MKRLILISLIILGTTTTTHALDPLTNVMLLQRAVQVCRAVVARNALLLPVEMRIGRVIARRMTTRQTLGCLGGRVVNPGHSPIVVLSSSSLNKSVRQRKVWADAIKRFGRLKIAGAKKYIHWGVHGVNQAIFVAGVSPSLSDEEWTPLPVLVAADIAKDYWFGGSV